VTELEALRWVEALTATPDHDWCFLVTAQRGDDHLESWARHHRLTDALVELRQKVEGKA